MADKEQSVERVTCRVSEGRISGGEIAVYLEAEL